MSNTVKSLDHKLQALVSRINSIQKYCISDLNYKQYIGSLELIKLLIHAIRIKNSVLFSSEQLGRDGTKARI